MNGKNTFFESVAPHVDPQWTEMFILTLKLRGAAGAQISDCLAEVDDHVAVCGLSVEEVFGSAEDYAKSLNLPVAPGNEVSEIYRVVVVSLVGFVGMTLILWASRFWREGAPIQVTVGMAVSAVITVAVMATVPGTMQILMPRLVKKRWLPFVFGAVWMALVLLPLKLFPSQVLQLPIWPVTCVGVVMVVISSLGFFMDKAPDDPIETPVSRYLTPPPRPHRQVALALLYPVATVALTVPFLLF